MLFHAAAVLEQQPTLRPWQVLVDSRCGHECVQRRVVFGERETEGGRRGGSVRRSRFSSSRSLYAASQPSTARLLAVNFSKLILVAMSGRVHVCVHEEDGLTT